MQDRGVLLDELASDPVGRDTVSVGDMKEEAHASDWLGQRASRLQ